MCSEFNQGPAAQIKCYNKIFTRLILTFWEVGSTNNCRKCTTNSFNKIVNFSFFPDQTFFRVRKNPDPIRKIRIREKNVLKLELKQKKCYISYLALSSLSFSVRLLQNLIVPSFRCLKSINGQIRTFKTQIRIRNTEIFTCFPPVST